MSTLVTPAAELAPFDYDGAAKKSFAFVHEGDDTFDVAFGRPNWMPVPMAMLMAGDPREVQDALMEEFEVFVKQAQPHAGWRDFHSELTGVQGWLEECSRKLELEMDRVRALDASRRSAEFDSEEGQDGYSGFTSVEAVCQFLATWHQTNTRSLCVWDTSSKRSIAYSRLPEVQALANAIEDMRICSLKWACSWLAESGMQVDHVEQLVLVPGYQPLRLKKAVHGD
ncbi:hypothetical protein AB2D15_23195 [Pseudomonas aeruginosa]